MIKQIKSFAGDYRVAGLKFFNGMEGNGWEGQLFRGEHYLGQVGDDATGGPVRINIINSVEYALLEQHAKLKVNSQYESTELFLTYLTMYQDEIKKLKTKAKQMILISSSGGKIDERGVPDGYTWIKLEDNPTNRARVLKKYPTAEFLNDDIAKFEVPRAKRI